jgi:hypothetical protein
MKQKNDSAGNITPTKFTPLLFVVAVLAGCATHRDDARLQGTWRLNRDATMAVSSNEPPHWVLVTYEHGAEVVLGDEAQYGNGNWKVAFHYHVVERGSNYVVIRNTVPWEKRRDIHIRFVDADSGYWIDAGPLGFGVQERFDKEVPNPDAKLLPPGMGGAIVPPPVQLDRTGPRIRWW